MGGVLETTIAVCGCKLLCSILCLPTIKRSISSISLCCCCLLLFTDLSITVFLAYLWCSAPSPDSFHPSTDDIALRFLLFLSKTYEAVLILTPTLVAIEVLLRFLWHREVTVFENTSVQNVRNNKHTELDSVVLLLDVDDEAWEVEPLQNRKERENQGISFEFLKAASFLGCLLLWCVSASYAGSIWKQDLPMVRQCLDKGGSLFICLPSLLTVFLPIDGQLLWLVATMLVVLALIEGLSLLFLKLAQFLEWSTFQGTRSTCGLPLQTFCSKWVKDHERCESNRKQEKKWNFVLQMTAELKDTVDSASHCLLLEYNNQRLANGNPGPISGQTGLDDGCRLQSKDVVPTSQQQSAEELPLMGTEEVECKGPTVHPHEARLWRPRRESPYLRGTLMTGLVCGLLVCVFPTVLSTNILLVRSLDTLAVCVVKRLLIATHSK